MMNFKSKRTVTATHAEHERYVALCALATSGTLSDADWELLQSHLAECEVCKKLIQEYREVAKTGMALLMPDASDSNYPAQKSWSVENARQELFARLARGETEGQFHLRAQQHSSNRARWFRQYLAGWRVPAGLAYAAAIMLMAGSMLTSYRFGREREHEIAQPEIESSATEAASLRGQLESLQREMASLNEGLRARDQKIAGLLQEVQRGTAEVTKWIALAREAEQNAQRQSSEMGQLSSEKVSLAAERDVTSQKLQETETTLVAARKRLDSLKGEREAEQQRSALLEEKFQQLSTRLKESQETVGEQRTLLAADRDIRELMGARELYIADVFDVGDDGRMRRPYGRVFYTRQKSLIFYAFDLDQQTAVRNASFQAWGRRGPADKQPLNLGILYLDNETNKRWALQFDDPKVLAQIDAVFVTIEPRNGSKKPSGKQLLFASLRTPPNHP